ncbi:MAG TPA: hypothetical protein DCY20_03545 [Firmicutes bacterium]|nr:hypothetical protein [Bacillota bacterium]
MNYPTYYIPADQASSYRHSLTNQVPYLVENPGTPQERFFFLPFLGGLAVGGLLGGWGNRPCCGGYYPPQAYPYPYPYPVYQQQQPYYYQQGPYQQTTTQNGYYGPYAPSMPNQNETTILESNKYYLS